MEEKKQVNKREKIDEVKSRHLDIFFQHKESRYVALRLSRRFISLQGMKNNGTQH